MQLARQKLLQQSPGPFFLPLGGAGEIGTNCYLYGSQGYWIAVDCGIGFLNRLDERPAVFLPDTTQLEENGINIQALLITHSHEDHIGALPWLASRLGCPIYASPFAAAMIRSRMPSQPLPLEIIRPLQPYSLGPFEVEWIPVTHSVPEAMGLALHVANKRIYHTGDWKLDPEPVVGGITATRRLQTLGESGVDLVIGDSTNATRPGHSASEGQVQRELLQAIQTRPNRILVTCFASNLARLHSLAIIARQTGRHLTLLGRSMQRVHGIGRQLGYLDDLPAPIPARDLGYLPRHEQLLVCTGSQGEPGSALARLAAGTHPDLELEAGDHVLFSSKTIPGNEIAVERLMHQLSLKQVEVMTDADAPIHASGHPEQQELIQMYQWLKPTCLLAMHGEQRHQQAHVELARNLGIQARSAENGVLYDLAGLPRQIDRLKIEPQRLDKMEQSA